MEFGLTSVASYWHLHLPQGQASAYKGSSIDHGLSADAIETSAVLQEDSCPQAILKLRPPNSLDYSTRYGCQPTKESKVLMSSEAGLLLILVHLMIINNGRTTTDRINHAYHTRCGWRLANNNQSHVKFTLEFL